MPHQFFKDVTLLITHYNRSKSLEQLLLSFKNLGCSFEEIIVSDDGSKPEHQEYLIALQQNFPFTLVTTPLNKGLGNNLNKGQDAVKTPYTLYVQEDFVVLPLFREKFSAAIDVLRDFPTVDIVRFYAYFKYPYLKPYRNGFSEMNFSPWYAGYNKFYYYSDHPHLRRSNFMQKFGRYKEGVNPEAAEYAMMFSFLQKKGKAMYYDEFKDLFLQENTQAEPSTMNRTFWRESDFLPLWLLRESYRYVKFNYDYFFRKF